MRERPLPTFAGALVAGVVALTPLAAVAQEANDGAPVESMPWLWVSLALVPLALVLVSAFVKVAVVLGLLRNAFGSNDVPPTLVITALAILISIAVLAPIASEVADRVGDPSAPTDVAEAQALWERASPPVLDFLERHTEAEERARFAEIVTELDAGASGTRDPADEVAPVSERRLDVLVPAFVARELTEAFQIGLLLLLPFVVLDLVVGALLQGAGLASVQVSTVSLPLKLLLFVMLDGWQLLLEALMLAYT